MHFHTFSHHLPPPFLNTTNLLPFHHTSDSGTPLHQLLTIFIVHFLSIISLAASLQTHPLLTPVLRLRAVAENIERCSQHLTGESFLSVAWREYIVGMTIYMSSEAGSELWSFHFETVARASLCHFCHLYLSCHLPVRLPRVLPSRSQLIPLILCFALTNF